MSLASKIVIALLAWTLVSIPAALLFGAWLKRSAERVG